MAKLKYTPNALEDLQAVKSFRKKACVYRSLLIILRSIVI